MRLGSSIRLMAAQNSGNASNCATSSSLVRRLFDSCGHPELSRRDADCALEVVGELALVTEAGVRGHVRQGEVAAGLQELLGPLDATTAAG